MGCKDCDDAHGSSETYPFRIGNAEIGWGTILVKCCEKHAELLMQILRGEVK
jgi:hypothetical protein